jgi:hypothetical protein
MVASGAQVWVGGLHCGLAAMNYPGREVLVLVAIVGLAGYLVGASGQSRQDQSAESAGETIVLRVQQAPAPAATPTSRPPAWMLAPPVDNPSVPVEWQADTDQQTNSEAAQPESTKLEAPRDVCAANGGWRETFAFHGVQRWRCRYPGR